MAELTYAQVESVLKYEPETGKFFWKERGPEHYQHTTKPAALAKTFNATFSGKEAFTTAGENGYKCGSIYNYPYRAHRVAWLLTYGEWPKAGIDHINGNPSDNRISNLRAADQALNCRNQAMNRRNTSGVTGVSFDRKMKKWIAQITVNMKTIHLGCFDDFALASAARLAAQREHGFSDRHGLKPDTHNSASPIL